MDACQYVHVDVPPCYAGDLIPYDTKHQQMDGPQQIHVDVHYEEPIGEKIKYLVK
jgi:hypothetical protein